MDVGRSILFGGLARIDMVDGRDCQFTVYYSQKVKLHRCRTHTAKKALQSMKGGPLTPPHSAERVDALQPWLPHTFEVRGVGWAEACVDVVFHGLGWVSITGCGPIVVRAWAPEGVEVAVRDEP